MLALCVVLLGLLACRGAAAQEGECGPVARAWAARCAAGQHMKVTPVVCVGDRATFRLETGGAVPLKVEISRAKGGALRAVPVGNFPNWERVPAARRALLARVRSCLEAGFDPTALEPATLSEGNGPAPRRPVPPWRALAAAALAAAVLLLSGRKVRRRRFLVLLVAACTLAAATFVFRRLLFPPAFFHQNGQGPDWIGYALGVPSGYGPGFFQLFGLAARVHPAGAERAVFLEAGLLAALGPVCVLLIARASGARPLLAWTLAAATAAAPALARVGNSESYFGVCTSLLLFAGAVLASGSREGRLRSWAFLLGVVSAGLFVAQAALVHSVCWMPAALIPLVVLAGRGSFRRRVRLLVVAGAGIAAVVAVAAGSFLLREMHSEARWGGPTGKAMDGALVLLARWLPLLLVAVVLLWWVFPRSRRAAVYIALLPLVALPGLALDQVLGTALPPWLRAGWWALVLPPGLALLSGALARLSSALRRPYADRLAAVAVAAVSAIWFAGTWRSLGRLPTDALEARFAEDWRGQLPRGSQLAYLQRAGRSIESVPIYDHGVVVHELSGHGGDTPLVLERLARLLRNNRPVYYYRSSLCSTPAGAGDCAAIERRLQLEWITGARLPARPSVPWTRYVGSSVDVGLFRVRDVHE